MAKKPFPTKKGKQPDKQVTSSKAMKPMMSDAERQKMMKKKGMKKY